jgi:hypothetical protein
MDKIRKYSPITRAYVSITKPYIRNKQYDDLMAICSSGCGGGCPSKRWPWQSGGGCSSSECGDDDCNGGCNSDKCKDNNCDKKDKSEPKNNDGRDECYWCRPTQKTQKKPRLNGYYDICPQCKK